MSKPDLRDALIAELQGQLAEMADQFEEYRTNSERLLAVETENARLTGQNEVLATVVPIGEHLGTLADGMGALEAKVRTLPRTQQGGVEDALALLQDQMTSLSQAVQMSLDGGPVRPLLSEVLEDWTEVRSGFGVAAKKIDTDRNRVLDFIEFAGDKPANKYTYYDVQRFANLLVRVPGNYSKIHV